MHTAYISQTIFLQTLFFTSITEKTTNGLIPFGCILSLQNKIHACFKFRKTSESMLIENIRWINRVHPILYTQRQVIDSIEYEIDSVFYLRLLLKVIAIISLDKPCAHFNMYQLLLYNI